RSGEQVPPRSGPLAREGRDRSRHGVAPRGRGRRGSLFHCAEGRGPADRTSFPSGHLSSRFGAQRVGGVLSRAGVACLAPLLLAVVACGSSHGTTSTPAP